MPKLRRLGAAAPEFLAGTQPEHALKERIGFFLRVKLLLYGARCRSIRIQRCPVIVVN